MAPGVVEETSKVAQQTITALNSVPILLALVLLQFFILGSVMYLNIGRDKNVHERFMKLIDGCLTIKQEQIQTPQRRGEFKLQSDESRPFNLPPRSSGAGVPGPPGSPSGPPPVKEESPP